jgi:hypothetical protein
VLSTVLIPDATDAAPPPAPTSSATSTSKGTT